MIRERAPASVEIEPDGDDACVVTVGSDDAAMVAKYLAWWDAPFEVLDSPELLAEVRLLAQRYADASRLSQASRGVSGGRASAPEELPCSRILVLGADDLGSRGAGQSDSEEGRDPGGAGSRCGRRSLGIPGGRAGGTASGSGGTRYPAPPAGRHQRRCTAHGRAQRDGPPGAGRPDRAAQERARPDHQAERDAAVVEAGAGSARALHLGDIRPVALPPARVVRKPAARPHPREVHRLGGPAPQRRGWCHRVRGRHGDVRPNRASHRVHRVRLPATPLGARVPRAVRRHPA